MGLHYVEIHCLRKPGQAEIGSRIMLYFEIMAGHRLEGGRS